MNVRPLLTQVNDGLTPKSRVTHCVTRRLAGTALDEYVQRVALVVNHYKGTGEKGEYARELAATDLGLSSRTVYTLLYTPHLAKVTAKDAADLAPLLHAFALRAAAAHDNLAAKHRDQAAQFRRMAGEIGA